MFFFRVFEWIIRHMFFLSYGTRASIINFSQLIRGHFQSMNPFGRRNKLTHRNRVPSPYYYTNYPNGKQSRSVLFKQLKVAGMKETAAYDDKVTKSPNPSYFLLSEFNITEEMMAEEVQNLNTVVEYNKSMDPKEYHFTTERLLGELIVNGQNPYALRRLQIAQEGLAVNYQQELFKSLKREEMDMDLLNQFDLGFNLADMEEEVRKPESKLYVMDLNELREVHPNEPFVNHVLVESLMRMNNVETVLQFPYAIFVKATDKKTNVSDFICVAAVLRYTAANQYLTVSPFFQKVRKVPRLWQMVRGHIAHAHFNDFTFRTHLGVLHLITEQYNVPLYNYLNFNKNNHDKLEKFFKYAFEPFNRGLEGINKTAFHTLVAKESPSVSNVFSLSATHAFEAISKVSENIDFNRYNPVELATRNGLGELLKAESESEVYFDHRIQEVIDKYINGVYDICGIAEFEEQIIHEINECIRQGTNRTIPIKDLRALFCNLAFCWVTYHAHTFCNLSLSSYVRFRPTAMSKGIPLSEREWPQVTEIEYLPDPKMLLSSEQLVKQVTFRDGDNFFTDVLARLSFEAQSNNELAIERHAINALDGLDRIEKELQAVNDKRRARNMFEMMWLHPSRMQASLNV